MKALLAIAAASLQFTSGLAAAAATPVAMEAQALTYAQDGRVQGCGLRLTGGQPGTPASSWFDVSFNLFGNGVGLAQSIAYEIRRSDYEGDSRPAQVPVRSTWVKAGQGSVRRGENAQRRDSLVYTLLADDVLALFEAVATDRAVTLGIRRWDEREDVVYTGTAILSADARAAVSACLARLNVE